MESYQSMRPAWVSWTSPLLRPPGASTHPSAQVAYLPVRPEADPYFSPSEVAYILTQRKEARNEWRRCPAPPQGNAGAEAVAVKMAIAGGRQSTGDSRCSGTDTESDMETEREAKPMAVIKNLPSRCREEAVVDVIDKLGFSADVAEFSMPTRVGKGNRLMNRGFAFVSFSDEEVCRKFAEAAKGHRGFGKHLSSRAISVVVSLHGGGALGEKCPGGA